MWYVGKLMPWKQWLWCHTVGVISYTMDMMLSTIADVISELQLVWYHQYSGCHDTDTVDKMLNIVGKNEIKMFNVILLFSLIINNTLAGHSQSLTMPKWEHNMDLLKVLYFEMEVLQFLVIDDVVCNIIFIQPWPIEN